MDLFRNPPSQALLQLLGEEPPLLYNRESCQVYHVPPPKGSSAAAKRQADPVDYDAIRAWAKGRQVTSSPKPRAAAKMKSPILILSNNDDESSSGIDQDELLLQQQDSALTPLQRKGKEAIQERTKAQAKDLSK